MMITCYNDGHEMVPTELDVIKDLQEIRIRLTCPYCKANLTHTYEYGGENSDELIVNVFDDDDMIRTTRVINPQPKPDFPSRCPKSPKYLNRGGGYQKDVCDGCEFLRETYTDDEGTLLKLTCDVSDYVSFSDVCDELGLTNQMGYYLLEGLAGCPDLGEKLRIINNIPGTYHLYMIHRDDVSIFIKRVKGWLMKEGSVKHDTAF